MAGWPQFHCDPGHSGWQSADTYLGVSNVSNLGVKWRSDLRWPVGTASPAVADGRVFIGSTDWRSETEQIGIVWACHPEDGHHLWHSPPLSGEITSCPAVAGHLVVVATVMSDYLWVNGE